MIVNKVVAYEKEPNRVASFLDMQENGEQTLVRQVADKRGYDLDFLTSSVMLVIEGPIKTKPLEGDMAPEKFVLMLEETTELKVQKRGQKVVTSKRSFAPTKEEANPITTKELAKKRMRPLDEDMLRHRNKKELLDLSRDYLAEAKTVYRINYFKI
ncbi:hypothetical protein ACLOJK_014297 [Asimina triloba]